MKKILLYLSLLASSVTVSAQSNAAFISQTVPDTIIAGESFTFSITYKNTGTTVWTPADKYRLGTQALQDNQYFGVGRIDVPDTVSPGDTVTFTTTLTAPTDEGIYVIQWRMVQEGVEWFGEKSEIIPFKNYTDSNAIFIYQQKAYGNIYDESMAVACMQGLVNRDGPIVYVFQGRGKKRPQYWYDIMTGEGHWLNGRKSINLKCIEELFVLAQDKIKGVVVWDPDVPASMNVATTMAGVEDLIVFSPEFADLNLKPWGLEVTKDLRGMFTGDETGSKKNDAYRWAIREYLSKGLCSDHFLSLYEDPFLTRSKGDVSYVVTRDWSVKNRSFVFDLSPWGDEKPLDDPDQPLGTDLETYKMILQEILKQTAGTKMTELTGFFSFEKYSNVGDHESIHDPVPTEWETVYLISPFNCYQNTVASNCFNQSFHSQAPFTRQTQNRPADTLHLENGKSYICIMMADYDSGTPLYEFLPDYWNDPNRGSMPFIWGIDPNLIETYPDIVSYYYETQTANDYFGADASAAGYMNPNRIKEEYLPLFIEHNKKFYDSLDMTISPMILDWDQPTPAVKDAFTQFSPDGYATIIMDLHGTGGAAPYPHVWKGMPITNLLNMVGQIGDPASAANAMSSAIPYNAWNTKPFYLFRIVWSSPSSVIDAINILKNNRTDLDIEVVDPYNFFKLLKDAHTPAAVHNDKTTPAVKCYQDNKSGTLSVEAESRVHKVEIFSITGRKMKVVNINFSSISVNDLHSGNLYLVKVYLDNKVVVKKIVIGY